MSVEKRIRIGIIGAGNIGNVHMETIKTLPGAQLAGVTDVYLPLAEKRAKEHQIEKVYANSDQLLGDPSIDAVVIAVSNEWHAPIAVQALEAGKHVLLEKPMAIDLASARLIVEAERKAGKVLMIPHQMRWEAPAIAVKEQVEKGALGQIYHAKATYLRRKGIPGWGTWFTQMDKSGGGPLIDLGVHMLDLSLYLMGNPKPVSVYGATYAEFGPRKQGIGTWGAPNWQGKFDVEDLATALVKFDNGATLSLDVSWAGLLETDNLPSVQLLGTEGGAYLKGSKGKLFAEKFDRIVETEISAPAANDDPRARMIQHFLTAIESSTPPITSVMTGYTNNLILDAIYRSSQSGDEVKLNWDI
ncbi:Gfo/Idh/MocA family protein [Paenibacillus roseipurpureus]|uniref:Gfo/Idh/MocA family oxidoreductase n=1 Tax=Paenibacillus roseopurpureus TaxID=2918901 RepID=A0AA96LJI6_9BACL|nr:Gfo/Idh/MocA family oxidoreductase [Paenibacillus sp. MBLB1832]WNR42237.1 Gfo/Idh/MocA family oxidoreductase [Paenibacillus sp. MBLB1832]